MNDQTFHKYADLIYTHSGIKLGETKKELVRARIAKRMHVLDISDYRDYYEYVVRDILTRMLETKGYKVVACSVGLNGIRKFEKGKGKHDLVMIDIKLPGMSGLDVAKKIKNISQKTPVIIIKEWDKELDADKFKKSGVDFIISKPFFMDETLSLVDNAVDMKAG